MIALLLFTGVAVVSGLAGLLVFWLRRKHHLTFLAVLGKLQLLLLALVGVGMTAGTIYSGILFVRHSSYTDIKMESFDSSPAIGPGFEDIPDNYLFFLAIAALIGLSILAALVFTVFTVYQYPHERRVDILASWGVVLLSILFLLGAAGTFVTSRLTFPVMNDAALHDRDWLMVTFIEPPGGGHLHFVLRGQTAVYEDFEIVAEVGIKGFEHPAGPHRFEIQVPESLKLRTPDRCTLNAVQEGGYYACTSASSDGDFRVRWDATPTKTGSARLRLLLPPLLRPSMVMGSNWKAIVELNGQPVRGVVMRSYERGTGPIAELNHMEPALSTDGCNLDLERGEIVCVIQILRTLGVSESTYAMLAIVGAVLAGGLGSGWLIQFLAWLWRKINPEPKKRGSERGDSAIEIKQ